MHSFNGISNTRAADGKLDGNYCISEIIAGITRDALDGQADGNCHWKRIMIMI